jgi:hypothetical protein
LEIQLPIPMNFRRTNLIALLLIFSFCTAAQDSSNSLQPLSNNYFKTVSERASKLDEKLDRKSQKALEQFQKQEERIRKKLSKIDSSKAVEVFGRASEKYNSLEQKLEKGILSKSYNASLDTILTSLKFLQQNPQWLSKGIEAKQKLKDAFGKVEDLKTKFQKAEEIKKFIKERRQYLKEQLSQLGFAKDLKRLNKQVYYFSQQINEYKSVFNDHKKAEKKALELLSKTKLFQNFLRKNSELASLFRLPGNPDDPVTQASLAGLQTRAQVNGLIQQQLSAGGPAAQAQFQQNMQQAQSQLNQLKNKLSQFGGGASDMEMPEGFKPNNQKTKGFIDRIELGTNIQSQKANGYFPVTTDLGLSIGYKLNDRSILGIGASYKMGLGKDIRHVKVSHQGAGLRSFVDWKIKGSFWVSGGYEMNYRSEFREIGILKEFNAWQRSGLVGISKIISIQSRFFKKTKLQLLWDLLSYEQVPRTRPIVFRIGYNLK